MDVIALVQYGGLANSACDNNDPCFHGRSPRPIECLISHPPKFKRRITFADGSAILIADAGWWFEGSGSLLKRMDFDDTGYCLRDGYEPPRAA